MFCPNGTFYLYLYRKTKDLTSVNVSHGKILTCDGEIWMMTGLGR